MRGLHRIDGEKSGGRLRKLGALTAVAALATAFAGCGSHVETALPDVPGSSVLLDVEIQSNVDDGWGRYMVLVGDDSISGSALADRIRGVLERDGWETRQVHSIEGSIEASKAGETGISFGSATSNMRYHVPGRVKNAVPDNPRAERRVVLVAIR